MILGTLKGGEWSAPRPGRLYPGKDPVPIVQEAGWASEPVWIGAENLAPTGIRSPDLPVGVNVLCGNYCNMLLKLGTESFIALSDLVADHYLHRHFSAVVTWSVS